MDNPAFNIHTNQNTNVGDKSIPTCDPSVRRTSTRPKKISINKIEADKSEAAFSEYESSIKQGTITIYSKQNIGYDFWFNKNKFNIKI